MPVLALVLGAIASVQFGGAAAATLFPRVGATGAVTLRLTIASILLLALVRPSPRGQPVRTWLTVATYGVCLGVMNLSIYLAMQRMELGAAVTVEFCGPLVLSAVLSRRPRDLVAVALAAAGVFLVSGHSLGGLWRPAVGFALLAGTMWACYILLAGRVGRCMPRLDGLAWAMLVATVLVASPGAVLHGGVLLKPENLVIGALVAVLSSVVPYSMELSALRRMPSRTFGILQSTGPAMATLAGAIVLGQRLTPQQAAGVLAVVSASALVTWRRGPAQVPR